MSVPPTPGRSEWFDLPATNLSDAMSFYEGLFNWSYAQMEDSPIRDYVMIEAGGRLIGGIRKVVAPKGAEPFPSAPILYFTVPDLSAKVARAKELGAEIIGETVDLGKGRGRYQWIRDREGTLIALWAAA